MLTFHGHTARDYERLTGITAGNATNYLTGRRNPTPATAARLDTAAQVEPGSPLLRENLWTYVHLAQALRTEDDPAFAVRMLKHACQHLAALRDPGDIEGFHIQPPTTHSRHYDAMLAALADHTYTGATGKVLAWTRAPRFYLARPFSPTDPGLRRVVADLVETPPLIRAHNVVLRAGDLAWA